MYKYKDLSVVLLYLILIVLITISLFAYKTKEYGSTFPFNRTENSQPSAVLDIIELKEQFPAPSTTSGSSGSNITQQEHAKAEETWKRSVERRFAERRESVRARCEEVGPYNYNAQRTAQMSFYCSKNYNIFVCVTAKSGATTWKTHLLRLDGVTEHFRNPHSGKYDTLIRASIQLNPDQLQEAATSRSATRIMTARNPLTRLVSAYRDKFNDGERPPVSRWGRLTARHCKNCTGRDGTLPFPQFLTLVLSEANAMGVAGLDKHYRPFSTVCSPCKIQYDYIFKQETFDEDLHYLTQVLRLKEVKTGLRTNTKGNTTQYSSYLDYYRDVPPDVLKQIYKVYEKDFRIFDYEFPETLLRKMED
ncbi:carbohydrate sulfotransferase 12-like [Penaeus chinensis]|uniref:carbohydrate sulfotransferase 12-like n=1 Tax=Penaeus chinensis TaxID=139456 RepID=UPI001FB61FAC|nr:carbohydrate sulfotransferase 12-like [Penaeus chinensis]